MENVGFLLDCLHKSAKNKIGKDDEFVENSEYVECVSKNGAAIKLLACSRMM